jgi:hypothetical protein
VREQHSARTARESQAEREELGNGSTWTSPLAIWNGLIFESNSTLSFLLGIALSGTPFVGNRKKIHSRDHGVLAFDSASPKLRFCDVKRVEA